MNGLSPGCLCLRRQTSTVLYVALWRALERHKHEIRMGTYVF